MRDILPNIWAMGVLVYFGYPIAHEEDAVRAVRSGLEIVAAVGQLAYTPPLQVRDWHSHRVSRHRRDWQQ